MCLESRRGRTRPKKVRKKKKEIPPERPKKERKERKKEIPPER
jgi:hypothetical protein